MGGGGKFYRRNIISWIFKPWLLGPTSQRVTRVKGARYTQTRSSADTVGATPARITWFAEQSLENMTPCGEWRTWTPPPNHRAHIHRPPCRVCQTTKVRLPRGSSTYQPPNRKSARGSGIQELASIINAFVLNTSGSTARSAPTGV